MNLVTFREITNGMMSELDHFLSTVQHYIINDPHAEHYVTELIFTERAISEPFFIKTDQWNRARPRCGQTAWGCSIANILITMMRKVRALEVKTGVLLATPAVNRVTSAYPNLSAEICKEIDVEEHATYQGHESEKLLKITLAGGQQQTLTWGMQQMIVQITDHFETLRYRIREEEREMTRVLKRLTEMGEKTVTEFDKVHAYTKVMQDHVTEEVRRLDDRIYGLGRHPPEVHSESATEMRQRVEKDAQNTLYLHKLIMFSGLGSVTTQNVVLLKGTTTADGNNIPAARLPNKQCIDEA